jgi:Leucine-rich repeat (LRR) protein
MRNLTHLELNWYPWSSISEAISDLPNLQELAIMNSVLADFPWEAWRQPLRLRRLALRNTDIREVRPSICRFRGLKRLELHANCLPQIPHEVEQLERLQDINLMCNPISADCREFLTARLGSRVRFSPSASPLAL